MKRKRTHGQIRRYRLAMEYRHDRYCRMCSCETVLRVHPDRGRVKPDTAVMVKWFPADDPRYLKLPQHKRRRLVCAACADIRHRDFEAELPLEELWVRSGRFGATYTAEAPA